jgi:hypothetical protein
MKKFLLALTFGMLFLASCRSAFVAESVAGLASKYPDDIGIKSNPAVILASNFEDENWLYSDFFYDWQPGIYQPYRTVDISYSGVGALEYFNRAGTHYPTGYHIPLDVEQDIVYMRYYRRYSEGYDFSCQSKTNDVGAYKNDPGAGIKPNGYDTYSNQLQVWPGGVVKFYTYFPDQTIGYGESFYQNVGTPVAIQPGRWYCIETMLKANTAGQKNGEIKLWIDGELKGSYTNLRFRDTDTLKMDEISLTAYVGGTCTAPKDQKIWDDNFVMATEYIGPMVTATVTITPTPIIPTETITPTVTPMPEIIIDDTDVGFSTTYTQDTWKEYTQVDGQNYGNSHHYNRAIGTGQDIATWSFAIPKPGNYDIYAWWIAASYRPADVKYIINGEQIITVSQRANGGKWNILGSVWLDSNGYVSVSDNSSTGRDIVADAIKLVYVSDVPPVPTSTAIPTVTTTPTPTPTFTPSPTPTSTPTATSTQTPTPTVIPTPTLVIVNLSCNCQCVIGEKCDCQCVYK